MLEMPKPSSYARADAALCALALGCAASIAALCWWPGWWTEEDLRDGAWVTAYVSSGLADIVFFAGAILAALGAFVWLGALGQAPQRVRWGRRAVVIGLVFPIPWLLAKGLIQAALGRGEWTRVGLESVSLSIHGPGTHTTVTAPAILAIWLMIVGILAGCLAAWTSRHVQTATGGHSIPAAAEVLILLGCGLGLGLLIVVGVIMQAPGH